MAKSIQLRIAMLVCWFFALTTCSAVVFAAEQERKIKGIEAIPFDDLKYIWPIITCAAILSTLTKMNKVDRLPVRSLPVEIAKDIFGSICAGGVTFLGLAWLHTAGYPVETAGRFIIIFFMAYGGSRIIEIMYNEGLIVWGRGLIARVMGRIQSGTGTPP